MSFVHWYLYERPLQKQAQELPPPFVDELKAAPIGKPLTFPDHTKGLAGNYGKPYPGQSFQSLDALPGPSALPDQASSPSLAQLLGLGSSPMSHGGRRHFEDMTVGSMFPIGMTHPAHGAPLSDWMSTPTENSYPEIRRRDQQARFLFPGLRAAERGALQEFDRYTPSFFGQITGRSELPQTIYGSGR